MDLEIWKWKRKYVLYETAFAALHRLPSGSGGLLCSSPLPDKSPATSDCPGPCSFHYFLHYVFLSFFIASTSYEGTTLFIRWSCTLTPVVFTSTKAVKRVKAADPDLGSAVAAARVSLQAARCHERRGSHEAQS